MHELFGRQAAASSDTVAVVHGHHAVTYGALERRAAHWASQFREHGIGPDALVGIHLRRTPELVAAMIGTLKAGGAYVALDPAYPRERLEFIVADAAISVLVTDEPDLARSAPGQVAVLSPDANGCRARPARRPGPDARAPGPANLAYVLYTSGSSGQPKGVGISHANGVDLLYWTAETFGPDLRHVLATTSICFDCSILEIFGPLSWGGTVVLAESPVDMGTGAAGWPVRLLHAVPSVIDELLRTERLPATVRTAILGGEALSPQLARGLYRRSSIGRLVNLYGPTECTSYATMAVIGRSPAGSPPIGYPVANTRVYVLDADSEPVRPGEPGEIFIAGRGLARGYLHRPGLTAGLFIPDPFARHRGERMYRTGDLAAYDEYGEITFLGRADEQLKIRGVRVEPGEVERALLAHPAVAEAVVAATVTATGRHVLAAFVVPSAHSAPAHDDLRAFLHGRLPPPLVPEAFVVLDQMPRTPNGKTDRQILAATPLPAPGPADRQRTAPSGELETMLAGLWAEAIESDRVAADSDVFDLGGHSLAALRVRARLSQLLGIDVPVRLFFENTTVASLAAEVEQRFGPSLPAGPIIRRKKRPFKPAKTAILSPTQTVILARADEQIDGPGLVLPVVVRLAGRLNITALRQAIALIGRRHHILGMVVAGEPGQRRRLVPAPGPRPWGSPGMLPLLDMTGVDATRRVAAAERSARALLARPLDVRLHPLLRAVLIRLGEDEHVLALGLHHLAGDAWSVEALSLELLKIYGAARRGGPPGLVPAVQHADWVAEQQRQLRSPAGQAQCDYWRSRLAELPVLRLPGDTRRHGPVGEVIQEIFTVPAPETARLRAVGREERATLYMALLSVFAMLLHTWSGQEDLPVGCPEAGRIRPELSTVIGPCIDAFILRCDLSGNPSFRNVLARVRDLAMEAYSNRDVSFVTLAKEVEPDPTRHPLYQASIVLQEWPSLLDPAYRAGLFARQPIGDVQISRFLDYPLEGTAIDIELTLFERDDELEAVMHCRSDVVTPEEATLLAGDFLGMIRRALAKPDAPLSELDDGSGPDDGG